MTATQFSFSVPVSLRLRNVSTGTCQRKVDCVSDLLRGTGFSSHLPLPSHPAHPGALSLAHLTCWSIITQGIVPRKDKDLWMERLPKQKNKMWETQWAAASFYAHFTLFLQQDLSDFPGTVINRSFWKFPITFSYQNYNLPLCLH